MMFAGKYVWLSICIVLTFGGDWDLSTAAKEPSPAATDKSRKHGIIGGSQSLSEQGNMD
jgi:hypothetical protein